MTVDRAAAWEVQPDDFGGQLVRHRHGNISAVCFVYSKPDRVWAECTMCAADLELEKPVTPATATA